MVASLLRGADRCSQSHISHGRSRRRFAADQAAFRTLPSNAANSDRGPGRTNVNMITSAARVRVMVAKPESQPKKLTTHRAKLLQPTTDPGRRQAILPMVGSARGWRRPPLPRSWPSPPPRGPRTGRSWVLSCSLKAVRSGLLARRPTCQCTRSSQGGNRPLRAK